MKKILDRLEAICRRWFYLIAVSITALAVAALIACEYTAEKRVYDIPEGVCYCPSCGTVMVLEMEAVER